MRESSRRSSTRRHRGITTRLTISGLAVACGLAAACAQGGEIAVGSSSAEVIRQRGAPDQVKALHGKVLEDVPDLAQAEQSGARIVFIYERDALRVWFVRGRVTRVTRGASPPNATSPAPAN